MTVDTVNVLLVVCEPTASCRRSVAALLTEVFANCKDVGDGVAFNSTLDVMCSHTCCSSSGIGPRPKPATSSHCG
jgi:hypothetical protein